MMETKSLKANHTPIPWRVGDAGHTIFGPKTDAPNPEIIAHMGNRATFKTNAQHIVKCVNMHDEMYRVIETLGAMSPNIISEISMEEIFILIKKARTIILKENQ